MQAFVLCAGRGERLRPYSDYLPKPLFPILGKPLLAILLDQLLSEGFTRVGLNTWHLAEKILAFVEGYLSSHPEIELEVFEEPELLGTCGALRNAAAFFTSPTLILNGDILTNFSLRRVYEAFERSGAPALMFLHRYPGLNRVRVRENWVTGFGEDHPQGFAYTGIQVVSPEWIKSLPPERELIPAYKQLLSQGFRIRALVGTGFYWQDIGTPENYLKAQQDLASGRAHIPWAPEEGTPTWPEISL